LRGASRARLPPGLGAGGGQLGQRAARVRCVRCRGAAADVGVDFRHRRGTRGRRPVQPTAARAAPGAQRPPVGRRRAPHTTKSRLLRRLHLHCRGRQSGYALRGS